MINAGLALRPCGVIFIGFYFDSEEVIAAFETRYHYYAICWIQEASKWQVEVNSWQVVEGLFHYGLFQIITSELPRMYHFQHYQHYEEAMQLLKIDTNTALYVGFRRRLSICRESGRLK